MRNEIEPEPDPYEQPIWHLEVIRMLRGHTSRESLAAAAGLSVGTIARIENGDGTPRRSTIDKLAQALETSVEVLVAPDVPQEAEQLDPGAMRRK